LLLKLVTSLRQDDPTQRDHKGTDEKLVKTAPLLSQMEKMLDLKVQKSSLEPESALDFDLAQLSVPKLMQMMDLVKFVSDQSLASDQYLYQPMLERLSGEKITVPNTSTKLGDLDSNSTQRNPIFETEKSLKKLQDPINKQHFNSLISLLVA